MAKVPGQTLGEPDSICLHVHFDGPSFPFLARRALANFPRFLALPSVNFVQLRLVGTQLTALLILFLLLGYDARSVRFRIRIGFPFRFRLGTGIGVAADGSDVGQRACQRGLLLRNGDSLPAWKTKDIALNNLSKSTKL